VSAQSFGGVLESGESGDRGEPLATQSSKATVRCAVGGFFLWSRGHFFSGVPLVDQRLDVALENFGKVVVAIEFVLNCNTGEGLDGGVN
jgi:hypothetical protein